MASCLCILMPLVSQQSYRLCASHIAQLHTLLVCLFVCFSLSKGTHLYVEFELFLFLR